MESKLKVLPTLTFILFGLFLSGNYLFNPFQNEEIVDCDFVSVTSFGYNKNNVTFSIKSRKNIEFPIESMPHFIKIISSSGSGFDLVNSIRSFNNIEYFDGQYYISTLLYHDGNIDLSILCNKRELLKKEITVSEITRSDYSYVSKQYEKSLVFGNVCVDEGVIRFFSPDEQSLPSLESNAKTIAFVSTNTMIELFLDNNPGFGLESEDTIYYAGKEERAWKNPVISGFSTKKCYKKLILQE